MTLQNQIGKFQNIWEKILTKSWMLDYCKITKHWGCKIYQIPVPRGLKSLVISGKHWNRERKRSLSYQTILATLAC